jgi:hypothetical protein
MPQGQLKFPFLVFAALFVGVFTFLGQTNGATEQFSLPNYPDGNLKSYWRLNSTTSDSIGNAQGTNTNVSYMSGLFGDATSYAGTSSKTVVPDNSALHLGPGDRTISFWIKTTDSATSQNFIGNRNDNSTWWRIFTKDSDQFYFEMGNNYPSNYKLSTSDSITYANGVWHHVAVVTNGSSIQWYFDGSAAGSDTWSPFNTDNTNGEIHFGVSNHGGYLDWYNGSLDDIVIFNRPLSADDIALLYSGSFYAQINTTGSLSLREHPNTSSAILKTLPGDWVVYVTSTVSATGTLVIADGYKWFNVLDKTDGVTGWMAASSSGSSVYLSYTTSTSQAALLTKAATAITTRPTRAEKIVEAVNWYYDHINSTDSLYYTGFSYLFSATTSVSSTWMFPKELFFAMASAEDGGAVNLFNNEEISFDYGHGIMQLTPTGLWSHEPNSSGNWINNAENVPAYGSHINIPPCEMIATTTYTRCYTFAATRNSTGTKEYKDYGYSNSSTTYKFYTNTHQSIFANIKDGLTVLKNKYNVSCNFYGCCKWNSVSSL